MKKKFKAFMEEGMRTFKRVSEVSVLFRDEMENTLKQIINERKDWGPFKKLDDAKGKSTPYLMKYPLINTHLGGKLHDSKVTIRICVSWYDSNTEYPIYRIDFYEQNHRYKEEFKNFDYKDLFSWDKYLYLEPDPNDLDLYRDFNLLIDEFVRFLNSLTN